MNRRSFLKGSIAGAGGLALAGPFQALTARTASAAPATSAGYGPLSPKASNTDGIVYLSLPPGFEYWSFNHVGTPLSSTNATLTPAAHDGMSCFAIPGSSKLRLVRNHENVAGTPFTTTGVYDSGAAGGCTIVEFDPANPTAIQAWGAISGTVRNCMGGRTPWGSWLTCEETTDSVPTLPHGYVFEVPAHLPVGSTVSAATPLTAMGRFAHEAVAVDPTTNDVYLTEDAGATSGFYRFIPSQPGVPGNAAYPPNLAAGGTLQMLAVVGQPQYEAITGETPGTELSVEWVTIPNPDSLSPSVFTQGQTLGGANFKRLEGAWWSDEDEVVYFNATEGGNLVDYPFTGQSPNGAGQVWAYKPSTSKLHLVYESPGTDALLKPDNLTISPFGNVWLFEDPDRLRQSFIRGLADDGTLFTFASNSRSGGTLPTGQPLSYDEFAGGTFSPDGSWLFVNIQTPGVTFAITGPFNDPTPPTDIPEVPFSAALLGVTAAATAVGAAVMLRNRGQADSSGATPA